MDKQQKKQPSIGIFIINYNAVNLLTDTISRIPEQVYEQVSEIFLIDDCSKDNSYYAALGYKHEYQIDKLTVMRNSENQGYGGNQKIGYQYAIDQGHDFVALLHGDGQYAPEILTELLKPLVDADADAVFGSRMAEPGKAKEGGMPLYKYYGNKILTNIQNRLSGLNLSEYHSGYRLYATSALRDIPFQSFTNTWHFDTQILLALAERDKKIVEIPIPTYYGDEICHVNGIPYALNCIKTTWRYHQHRKEGKLMFPAAEQPVAPQ